MDCVCGKFKEVIRDDVSFVDSMQSVLVWSAQLSRVVGLQVCDPRTTMWPHDLFSLGISFTH